MRTWARIVLGALGGGLGVWGALSVLIGTVDMIFPGSAQMANDADPFAEPPTFEESAWLTGASVSAFLFGAWLCWRLARRS